MKSPEEIASEIAKKITNAFTGSYLCTNSGETTYCLQGYPDDLNFMMGKEIAQAIREARKEALDKAAKVALDYHWEIKWRGEPKTKTKAGVTGEEIAKAIEGLKERK